MKTLASLSAACLAFGASTALAGDYDCDAHAAHIDKVIGADNALKAYAVLHDHKADPDHLIDKLKAEHPDVEKELEEFAAADCSKKYLVDHAHDH